MDLGNLMWRKWVKKRIQNEVKLIIIIKQSVDAYWAHDL